MSPSLFRPSRVVPVVSMLLLLAACSREPASDISTLASADGILKFVPADTPYALVKPGELPADLRDKLEPQLDSILDAYYRIMREVATAGTANAGDGEDVPTAAMPLQAIDALQPLMSLDGLRSAGVTPDSQFAFYGVGLLPVMRVTLSDPALMESAIAGLEERLGQKLATDSIGGQLYRYAGDESGRLIVGIFDSELVLALAPTNLAEEQLKAVLGLTLPAQNIAAAGVLKDIAAQYGFTDYMVGVLDVERVAATFLDDQTGVNAEVLRLMDYDPSALSDVCRAEIRGAAGIVPKVLAGYTAVDARHLASRMIVALRPDIATGVSALAGRVPGLGAAQDGLMTFGMSMNLGALRDFYAARLDALDAAPFQCEYFADVQSEAEQGRDVLNQPVPPVIYGFNGFLAVIDDIEGLDFGAPQPPSSIDMRLLIAMDNAEALLAMGAMFSPEIAAMDIEPDGQPVRLDIPAVAATGQTVYVSMTKNSLGFSVGDEMETGLPAMLSAPVGEPPPVFAIDMDAGRYYGMLADAMAAGSSDTPREVQLASQDMLRVYEALMDRIQAAVYLTGDGIDIRSDVTLKD